MRPILNNSLNLLVGQYCSENDSEVGFRLHRLAAGESMRVLATTKSRFIYVFSGHLRFSIMQEVFEEVSEGYFAFVSNELDVCLQATQVTEVIILQTGFIETLCHWLKFSHPEDDKQPTMFFHKQQTAYNSPQLVRNILRTVYSYIKMDMVYSAIYRLKECELFIVLNSQFSNHDFLKLFQVTHDNSSDFKTKVKLLADQETSITIIAEKMGLERSHFHRLFKKEFNETPQVWLQKRKAERILYYIHNTNMPLKQVADELNFSSQTHLNEFCKKHFGMTARILREQL